MRGLVAIPAAALLAIASASCAPALRPPPATAAEIARSAPDPEAPVPGGTDVGAIERAHAAWSRRPDPAAVREAERFFLEAADADTAGIAALIGAARAKAWLAEHETDRTAREALARSLVATAQLCAARAPAVAGCDYWLGIALGVQARERPSTAGAGLREMIAALRRADAAEPLLDDSGPARVLALVHLRAPGWPVGPGDPDEGLAYAKRALAASPDFPPNLLAVAEALEKTGSRDDARASYERARAAASRLAAAGDPDAAAWIREAEAALAH